MGFIFYCSSTVYYKTTLLKIYISSFCNKPKLLFLFDVNNYNCNGMFLLMFRETHLLFAYKESNTKSLTDIRWVEMKQMHNSQKSVDRQIHF